MVSKSKRINKRNLELQKESLWENLPKYMIQ